MNQKEIGKRIKLIRESQNLTREEFAKKLNVSIYTVANYEQGQRGSNMKVLSKIADVLGVSTGYLLDTETKVYDLTDHKTKERISKIPRETLIEGLNKKIEDINQNAADAMIDIGIYASLDDEMQILKLATDEQIENILNNLGRYLKFELYELKGTIENK